MKRAVVEFPDPQLVECTDHEAYAAEWKVSLEPADDEFGLWQLRLDGETDAVNFTVEYLLKLIPADETGPAKLIPVLATETAAAADRGTLLLRRQTVRIQAMHEASDTEWKADYETASLYAVANPQKIYSASVLDVCSDYLWHNQGLDDPPGSFNHIILLSYRRMELDPEAIDPYPTTAWLLWSKWVTWKNDPETMPDGEHKLEEAMGVLKQGRAANPESAAYHFEAAVSVMPLARFHRPDLYDFVESYLEKADRLATEEQTRLRVRTRKILGHVARQQDKLEEAMQWYRKVLELDADHEVANRYLRQLQDDAAETTLP